MRGGRRKGTPIHGWLAIHKEPNITSAKVVERVLQITKAEKAGHGGTLDPFSEGLLPIALGDATKTLSLILEGDKEYQCWVCFGRETDSGDLTGETLSETGLWPSEEELQAALPHFLGTIEQVPPAHSAIRINGVRSYRLAHAGELLLLPSRLVHIHKLTLESYQEGVAKIVVRCGKGTYMRALARDLGRFLQVGAHLQRLIRTETLAFQLKEALDLEALRDMMQRGVLQDILFSVDRVLDDIPALRLTEDTWRKVRNGQEVRMQIDSSFNHGPKGRVRLLTPEGRFAAIAELGEEVDANGCRSCHPKKLFLTGV
ncbi:MAG: tRNA pseudouridine(55) synthase TruB [Magnetococcus sp. DMHC-6]